MEASSVGGFRRTAKGVSGACQFSELFFTTVVHDLYPLSTRLLADKIDRDSGSEENATTRPRRRAAGVIWRDIKLLLKTSMLDVTLRSNAVASTSLLLYTRPIRECSLEAFWRKFGHALTAESGLMEMCSCRRGT